MPCFDQLGHRADGLLDRRPSGRRGAGSRGRSCRRRAGAGSRRSRAHVLGAAVDAARERVVGAAHDAELRRERRPRRGRPASGAADQLLVRVRPVHVGGVEQVDAELERAVDRGDRLGVVAAARRTPTSPCSRGRWRRPRAPALRAAACARSPPSKAFVSILRPRGGAGPGPHRGGGASAGGLGAGADAAPDGAGLPPGAPGREEAGGEGAPRRVSTVAALKMPLRFTS